MCAFDLLCSLYVRGISSLSGRGQGMNSLMSLFLASSRGRVISSHLMASADDAPPATRPRAREARPEPDVLREPKA